MLSRRQLSCLDGLRCPPRPKQIAWLSTMLLAPSLGFQASNYSLPIALASSTVEASYPLEACADEGSRIRPSTAPNIAATPRPLQEAPSSQTGTPSYPDKDSVAASFSQPIASSNVAPINTEPNNASPNNSAPIKKTSPAPISSLGSMTIIRQPAKTQRFVGGPEMRSATQELQVSRPQLQNWSPTPSRFGADDQEANQRPTLATSLDESYTPPSLPFKESSSLPNASLPVIPSGYESYGARNDVPLAPNPALRTVHFIQQPPQFAAPNPALQQGVYPGAVSGGVMPQQPAGGIIPSPLNANNLPRYEQPRVVSQEPFVTAPPCRFDAYNMVTPAGYQQCAPGGIVPIGGVPVGGAPYSYAPPSITPNLAPGLYAPNNSGWKPLFTLGQENYNAQLGRGLFGQPTAYVNGQPFRNFFRYVFP